MRGYMGTHEDAESRQSIEAKNCSPRSYPDAWEGCASVFREPAAIAVPSASSLAYTCGTATGQASRGRIRAQGHITGCPVLKPVRFGGRFVGYQDNRV
jgi:hypothetical protein